MTYSPTGLKLLVSLRPFYDLNFANICGLKSIFFKCLDLYYPALFLPQDEFDISLLVLNP